MRNIILSVLFLFISSLAFAQNGGWNGGGSGGTGSGTVSSGTTNQEAVYTGSTTVGSGNITDNGNIGIGSSNPGQALDVNGTVRVSNGNIGIGVSNPQYALDTGSCQINTTQLNTGSA